MQTPTIHAHGGVVATWTGAANCSRGILTAFRTATALTLHANGEDMAEMRRMTRRRAGGGDMARRRGVTVTKMTMAATDGVVIAIPTPTARIDEEDHHGVMVVAVMSTNRRSLGQMTSEGDRVDVVLLRRRLRPRLKSSSRKLMKLSLSNERRSVSVGGKARRSHQRCHRRLNRLQTRRRWL